MCRSIRTLRPPQVDEVTDGDVRAAARQYVRKLSGFREPSAVNRDAFEHAIDAVAAATTDLLEALEVRGATPVTVVPGPETDLRALRRAERAAVTSQAADGQ